MTLKSIKLLYESGGVVIIKLFNDYSSIAFEAKHKQNMEKDSKY